MEENINKFRLLKDVDIDLKKRISYYHVFLDINRMLNALFVTDDDRVYAIGRNFLGVLGVGHGEEVNELQELTELQEKNVCQFVIAGNFAMALTTDHKMYGWGANNLGQMTVPPTYDIVHYRPVAITFFDDKDIAQVCGGGAHALLLTTDGHVYGWGSNTCGQAGFGKDIGMGVWPPRRLQFPKGVQIKKIWCMSYVSFGLTTDGQVYSWGFNIYSQLGHPDTNEEVTAPRLVTNISNAVDVCGISHITYVLTSDGRIHYCGNVDEKKQKEFRPMATNLLFTALASHTTCYDEPGATALSEQGVYLLQGKSMTRTSHKTLSDFYMHEHSLTLTTRQVRHSRVMRVMAQAFDSKDFYDLRLKLKKKGIDDRFDYIYVQKWFLGESVQHLRQQLATAADELSIDDHSYEAYYQYIRWLYTDFVYTTDAELLIEMLAIGDHNRHNEFVCAVVGQLKECHSIRNCCLIYEAAVKYEVKDLKRTLSEFIKHNMEQVVATEAYKALSPQLVKRLKATKKFVFCRK